MRVKKKAELTLGEGESLHHEHQPATAEGSPTFVFVNSITGDAGLWNQAIYGTLVFKFQCWRAARRSAWC